MEDPYENESGITVGELIEQLSMHPKSDPVCFGPHGHFTFYRVKDRGGCTQIEFNEAVGREYELLRDHPYREHLRKIGME